MAKIAAEIDVCTRCMILAVNGEDTDAFDPQPNAPAPWSRINGGGAVASCTDCDSGDSHAFLWRATCDACGAEVTELHGMSILE